MWWIEILSDYSNLYINIIKFRNQCGNVMLNLRLWLRWNNQIGNIDWSIRFLGWITFLTKSCNQQRLFDIVRSRYTLEKVHFFTKNWEFCRNKKKYRKMLDEFYWLNLSIIAPKPQSSLRNEHFQLIKCKHVVNVTCPIIIIIEKQ